MNAYTLLLCVLFCCVCATAQQIDSYNCNVTDTELGHLQMLVSCEFENPSEGFCAIKTEIFDKNGVLHDFFNCEFQGCSVTDDSTHCTTTSCLCTDWCGTIWTDVIANAHSTMDFNCSTDNLSNCTMTQGEWSYFVPKFFLNCNTTTPTPPFDGLIRPNYNSQGRYDAYLMPPYISNHASFIELMADSGDLIVGWFSGTGEGQSGVSIVTTILPQGSTQWSNTTVQSQRIGYSNQNPVLFYNNTNDLYLFHTQQPASGGESNSQFMVLHSTNGGQSFSTPQVLFSQPGIWDRNRIVLGLQNDWIFPMYHSVPGTDSSFIYRKPFGASVVPATNWKYLDFPNSDYLIQPTVVRIAPNSPNLIAFLRDENNEYIYYSVSKDDGKTWTNAAPTILPNNNSGISAYTLQSGNIALIYNPLTQHRNILVISLSTDGGLSWKYTKILEIVEDASAEFSYPSLLQTKDGYIHITYTYYRETIKYTKITEAWIMN